MKTVETGSYIGLISNISASGVTVTPVAPTTSTDLQSLITELVALIAAADVAALDEGVSLTTALASLNFAGAGVTATVVGNAVTVTIPGVGSASLDDLSDVVITAPATAQRLRYDGSVWRNSSLFHHNVTAFDGTNWSVLFDGAGNCLYAEG